MRSKSSTFHFTSAIVWATLIFVFSAVLFTPQTAAQATERSEERSKQFPAARTKLKRPIGKILSMFAPVGNNVIVSGSVTDARGAPIANSVVTLMDDENGLRYARTGTFGQFVFQDVVPNETYVVSVAHRKYLFAFPAFVIEVQTDVTDIVFVGEDDQF